MKKIYSLAMAIIVCAFSLNAVAQTTKYVKVTEEPADWTGTYLIVYEDDANNLATVFNGALEELDAVGNYISVGNDYQAINGAQIRTINSSAETDAATFSIVKSEKTENAYNIQSASGYWIGYNSFKDPEAPEADLKSDTEKRYDNTIAMEAGKTNVIITAKVGYELRWNNDKDRFRYHESGKKKAVKLYRKVLVSDNGEIYTGISHTSTDTNRPAAAFTVSGQKATANTHGITIVNGKKIVVR